MRMNLTELLTKMMDCDYKHICLNIITVTDLFNLCFIEYEDDNKIGVYITGEDGRERFLIINKEHIVSLQVVYEQDINIEKETEDVMVI